MARAIPIDIIKGIGGKYGKDADFYFAITPEIHGQRQCHQAPRNKGATALQASEAQETMETDFFRKLKDIP